MTIVAAAVLAPVFPAAACAHASTAVATSAPLAEDVAGKPVKSRGFPTFCGIPPRPANVRSGKAFKDAVVSIRLAGVHVVAETSPGAFSLEDTAGFADATRAKAVPPPPMAPPNGETTEAFISRSRALARQPGPR